MRTLPGKNRFLGGRRFAGRSPARAVAVILLSGSVVPAACTPPPPVKRAAAPTTTPTKSPASGPASHAATRPELLVDLDPERMSLFAVDMKEAVRMVEQAIEHYQGNEALLQARMQGLEIPNSAGLTVRLSDVARVHFRNDPPPTRPQLYTSPQP